MRILALDPGGSTGWTTYDDESGADDLWRHGVFTGQHHLALWEFLNETQWDVVIYERFQYQRRELDKGVSLVLDSVQYIGVTELWHARVVDAYEYYKPTLVCQTPAQAKNLWTDDKLKKVGLWTTSPHSRDATRHLLYYLTVTLGQREWIMRTRPESSS